MSIHCRGVIGIAAAAFIAFQSSSLVAQSAPEQPSAQQIRTLETKLDELERQAAEIRAALEALKAQVTPPTPGEPEDLTQVEAVAAPEGPAAAPPPAPAPEGDILDVQLAGNPPVAGASKIFNPDISVIADLEGHAGDRNESDPRDALSLEEVEIAFEAFVDPYAKARFFLTVTPDEVEIEEGYASFVNLPIPVTVKAGKVKATFGKANTWHTHIRPWVDQPLVIHNFFGDEQLADTGVSVSYLFPTDLAVTEGTVEVFSGNAEAFQPQQPNDLFYNTHLKVFHDLSENSNVEIGASLARGTVAQDPEGQAFGSASHFGGLDFTYRWKPLGRSIYRSFIGRAELIVNDREDLDDQAIGYYGSADYQLARRWITGIRLDSADDPLDPSHTDRGASLLLTFRPSEFSQLRGQLRRTRYGNGPTANELLFHLQFAIGAHGAHVF